MAKKIKETEKQKKQRIADADMMASNYGTAPGSRATDKKVDKSRQKYKDRMEDNAFDVRKGSKTKKGPGFKNGGKVTKGTKKRK